MKSERPSAEPPPRLKPKTTRRASQKKSDSGRFAGVREPTAAARRNWVKYAGSLAEPVLHEKGTRMYLISRHKRLTGVAAVLILIFANSPEALAHGGGHGGGGGGHGGGGHGGGGHGGGGGGGFAGGGGHFTGGYSSVGRSSWAYRLGIGPAGAGALPSHYVVDSPGFPEDMPEARIHRFLQQHLPHPHWVHWFHA